MGYTSYDSETVHVDHRGRECSRWYVRQLQKKHEEWEKYGGTLQKLARAYDRAGMYGSAEQTRRDAEDIRTMLQLKL